MVSPRHISLDEVYFYEIMSKDLIWRNGDLPASFTASSALGLLGPDSVDSFRIHFHSPRTSSGPIWLSVLIGSIRIRSHLIGEGALTIRTPRRRWHAASLQCISLALWLLNSSMRCKGPEMFPQRLTMQVGLTCCLWGLLQKVAQRLRIDAGIASTLLGQSGCWHFPTE